MHDAVTSPPQSRGTGRSEASRTATPCSERWERPVFQVVPLDCEITAYAPAGDEPLF